MTRFTEKEAQTIASVEEKRLLKLEEQMLCPHTSMENDKCALCGIEMKVSLRELFEAAR